jgi:ubiquinone/menaquinone biosynthesis C-methylase UbiE
MEVTNKPGGEPFRVAPYFDVLLERLDGGDRRAEVAFGRHVHWGYWPDTDGADGSPEDYAAAAERLCRKVCDAAGIRDGMRVLDVGCGLGGTIASLNERFNHLDMVGVNIDARQLRRAAKTVRPANHNRIRFQEADACDLPFDDASFDAVLAVECVFHFPSRATFLLGAARALVPGGRLALSDFVPPADALATLNRFNPGQDEATRLSYGAVNLLCPVGEYRLLAGAAGLTLLTAEKITANTMPTYAFLRADQRLWPDRATARMHERATMRLEMACRENLLDYRILSFGRVNANTSVAA